MSNPWSSPIEDTPLAKQVEPPVPGSSLDVIAKRTFLAWEKLRVLYIAILAVVTLLACIMSMPWRDPENLILIIPCAIAANVLYLAGPAVDTYIRWLGYRESWPRFAMFIGGTALSAILAVFILSDLF